MNQNTDILHEARKLRLLAAALELQHFTRGAANIVPIPGGDRVIAIGTPAQVRGLLGAAPDSGSDELRRAVQQITAALAAREWAEHVSGDPDAAALESQITELVGRASGSDGTAAADVLNQIADLFGIGSAARTPSTILENVLNTVRRADCLSAIERQFFMVECEPDEEDDEPGETCLLNWGDAPEQYAQQFGEVLPMVATPAPAAEEVRWSKAPPTEQADYWHWDGDEDHAPMIYHVMWSGTAKKCFVSIGQYGIDEAIWCDNFGGYWMKIEQPSVRAAMSASQGKTEEAK